MKKILMFSYLAVTVIVLANVVYYKSLYNRQIDYITTLLDHQVRLSGIMVDETNNSFSSDLSKIAYQGNLVNFFEDKAQRDDAVEKIRLFYMKYSDFIRGIKIFDDRKNEFTLKTDAGEWLEQQFVLHNQNEIYPGDTLLKNRQDYEYSLPIIRNNTVSGNLVVTVDHSKYFSELFSACNLKDYQWQWVINSSDEIIFSNSKDDISFTARETERIWKAPESGTAGNIIHRAEISGRPGQIVSSYYSTRLLQRDLTLVFSTPTTCFKKYIIRNSFFIVISTVLLFLAVLYLLIRQFRKSEAEKKTYRESEAALMKLIENIPAGIVVYNSKREILAANTMAASLYSYGSAAEMTGRDYPGTSLTAVGEYFARNPAAGIDRGAYDIFTGKSGSRIFLKKTVPLDFRGGPAYLDILTDVTELEHSRTGEAKANKAKSEFLARLSYEIRTPLTGIIGMTDLLNMEKLGAELRETMDLLRSSADDLMKVREDILDFSRIETGRLVLEEIPFDLRAVIDRSADPVREIFIRKNISFTADVDPGASVSIISDPYRFRQILTNLLMHSAGNTYGGQIHLSCRMLENDRGHVKLEFGIRDTGKVFDQEALNKIFGEVVNIESKILDSNDETGFGPVMAAQLIRLMGGDISVKSPSGLSGDSGTGICFTLRVYSNDRLRKHTDISAITSFTMIRTLVITDPSAGDEDILNLLHKLQLNISLTNFQKSTAGQIKANLDSGDEKYNLIIILNDRKFDGFEVVSSLWDQGLHEKLILMMISNHERQGDFLKSILLAVDHYLVMPVDSAELEEVLAESFTMVEIKTGPGREGKLRNNISALVVEDNKLNQKVISRMLGKLGCSFEMAADGYEGIRKAGGKKYDIIFMDLLLPGIDGFESASRILEEVPDTLIVALTADNMPNTRSKARLAGIREFISKPVRMEDLKRLLLKYFGNDFPVE